MNKGFGFLMWALTMLVILAQGLYGQTGTKNPLPCDPVKLDSLVGTVSLSLGNDRVTKGAMTCLLKLWHENKNRGGLDFYVSNAFLSLMEENPPVFFSVMSGESQTLHEWLEQLPDLSFTWSEDPPCGLEAKRRQLVSILQHSEIKDSKASMLKAATIKRLSSIRCRQID
jgi:hypothetical protein